MAFSKQSFNAWRRDNPNQLLALAVAVIVIGASLWVGVRARGAAVELGQKRDAWQQTSSQLAAVQQQFRAPTSTESAALIAESGRMGALGVPPNEKLNLIDVVGRLAEAYSLRDVRVNSSPVSDSVFVTPRAIGAQTINPATYALTLEFTGSFAGLVRFVSSLPPSISIARLGAVRRGSETVYQMVLSVYELGANGAD